MINKSLNIGDYIFTASGRLGRIIKINKQSYTYEEISSDRYYSRGNIAFTGLKGVGVYTASEEWFVCEDVQAKALEIAMKQYEVAKDAEKRLTKIEELIGKAKSFLKQIEDIEELKVSEEDCW